MRRSILPTGSTALERAVDQAVPLWDALANAAEPPSTRASEAHKNYLAAQWGLGPLAPYFGDVDALLAGGIPWVLERGSAASVKRALGWIGFPHARIDEDEAWLHIDTGRVFDDDDLRRMAALVRASIPAHVHFYRAYHVWDVRVLRLDSAPPLDGAALDDDSGIWVDVPGQQPVKGSQAQSTQSMANRPGTGRIAHATHAIAPASAWNPHTVLLDAGALDSQAETGLQHACTARHVSRPGAWQQRPPGPGLHGAIYSTVALHRLGSDRTAHAIRARIGARAPTPFAQEQRTWQSGTWDSSRWRTPIHHRTTEEP